MTNKKTKKYQYKEPSKDLVPKIMVVVICLLTACTIFMTIFKMECTFHEGFKKAMDEFATEAGEEGWIFSDQDGMNIPAKGFQLAFGVPITTALAPIPYPAEPFLAVCYLIPILFALGVIPIKAIDNKKWVKSIKYSVCGLGMIAFGIVYLLFVASVGKEMTSILLEKSPTLGIQIFSIVEPNQQLFPSLCQFIYILGGGIYLYLAWEALKNQVLKPNKTK